MIGNDVVDLTDAEVLSATHPRFDARVFAQCDRELLAASAEPTRLRWRLWAAKEAAFKVARKLDVKAVWSPSRFVVDVAASIVRWRELVFSFSLDEGSDYVHAACLHETSAQDVGANFSSPRRCEAPPIQDDREEGRRSASPWRTEVRRYTWIDDPGWAARTLAVETAAKLLGCDSSDLSIITLDRIPRLLFRGAAAPLDLSLSHHGRFVACALEHAA